MWRKSESTCIVAKQQFDTFELKINKKLMKDQ